MKKRLFQSLEKLRVLRSDDHFVLASGSHSDHYFDKDAILTCPKLLRNVSYALVEECDNIGYDFVVGPAMGGAILAVTVARSFLDNQNHHNPVWTGFTVEGRLRPGNRSVEGQRVLVVEDVLTTGLSVIETIRIVRAAGGKVQGVAAICNRGNISAEQLDVPKLVSLVDLPIITWPETECPLCQSGVPINAEVGHGRDFIARQTALF